MSYFRLVGCHLEFSTRGNVDHDCWTFRCFVHSHKSKVQSHKLYCFWNDVCICKTSIIIRTSGNLAAILDRAHIDVPRNRKYHPPTRTVDPENIGVAVRILSLCALELEICLEVFHPSLPPPLPANVAKTVAGRRVKTSAHDYIDRPC